jgi:hypothetical protein
VEIDQCACFPRLAFAFPGDRAERYELGLLSWNSPEPPRWSSGFEEMKALSSASRVVRVPTVGRFEDDIWEVGSLRLRRAMDMIESLDDPCPKLSIYLCKVGTFISKAIFDIIHLRMTLKSERPSGVN